MKWVFRLPLLGLATWLAAGGAGAQDPGVPEPVIPLLDEALIGEPVVVEEPAAPKPMSESVSRQFVVHGADLQLRSAVAGLAEETKDALEKEVGAGDGWKVPVVIELREPVPGAGRRRSLVPSFFTVPGGFRLQLDVFNLDRGLDHEAMERAVLELLLYERALRGRDPLTFEDELSLPWWLTEGLLESFRWRRNEGDRELYEAIYQSKGHYAVERLLEVGGVAEMGAGERTAFRASAGVLVMALLRQDGGKEGMASLLAGAATFRGQQEALLKEHFPGMNLGKNSLTKWWALELADLSKMSVTETKDILASEEALERALVVRMEDPAAGLIEFRPEQFRDLLAVPVEKRAVIVRQVADSLNLMSFQIFPGYRPIIFGYLTVLADIVNDKDEQIEERLATLAERRAELVSIGKRVRDLLDWYRINTAVEVSGEFDDYLKLKRDLEENRSEDRSPVVDYLRGVQAAFQRD